MCGQCLEPLFSVKTGNKPPPQTNKHIYTGIYTNKKQNGIRTINCEEVGEEYDNVVNEEDNTFITLQSTTGDVLNSSEIVVVEGAIYVCLVDGCAVYIRNMLDDRFQQTPQTWGNVSWSVTV